MSSISSHMGKQFKIKVSVTGPHDDEALRILHRRIRWTREGVIYENDHGHAAQLIEELKLKPGQSVVTPVIRESRKARKKDIDRGAQKVS